jgi:hypothetical protein
MAYVSIWQSLSEALTAVMEANRCSKDEAQADICRAIADRVVHIQCTLKTHPTRLMRSKDVLEGEAFEIRRDLKPDRLDWERSCPRETWPIRRGAYYPPGHWELQLIQLLKADVTNVLCIARRRAEPADPGSRKTIATRRSTPVLDRTRRAIEELFPDPVPEQAVLPNAQLCRRVGVKLRNDGLPNVSDDTILRAAGRRK